jgi:hypothetical protein
VLVRLNPCGAIISILLVDESDSRSIRVATLILRFHFQILPCSNTKKYLGAKIKLDHFLILEQFTF